MSGLRNQIVKTMAPSKTKKKNAMIQHSSQSAHVLIGLAGVGADPHCHGVS